MKKTIYAVLVISAIFLSFACVPKHEHDFSQTECGQVLTCSICGQTKDEIKEHTWIEATCTTPKICAECGQIGGDPLGHTTNFGVCERCGAKVGKELLEQFDDEAFAINTITMTVSNTILDYSDREGVPTYSMLITASDSLEDTIEHYNKVIDLCGDNEKLSKVKEAALEARNSIPLRPYEDSSICKKAWLEDMVDYTTDCAMFYLEIAEIAGEQ